MLILIILSVCFLGQAECVFNPFSNWNSVTEKVKAYISKLNPFKSSKHDGSRDIFEGGLNPFDPNVSPPPDHVGN